MSAPQGMIQALVAPRLKSIRTEDVLRFQEEYEEYRRHAREWQEGAGRYNPVRTPGYKACVSTDLLLSMVTLSMFQGVTSIEQLTDDHVREWVLSKSRRETAGTAESVKQALRKVIFRPDTTDPEGSVLKFFAEVASSLREERVGHVLCEASETIIQQLIEKIEPKTVREEIRDARKYWNMESKADMSFFVTEVTKLSVEYASFAKR